MKNNPKNTSSIEYYKGYEAFSLDDDVTIENNPYEQGCDAWSEWRKGFIQSCNDHLITIIKKRHPKEFD